LLWHTGKSQVKRKFQKKELVPDIHVGVIYLKGGGGLISLPFLTKN
jgi:hypothetical protein